MGNNNNNEIAIIGMACRFPGGANSPEEYWQLLSEGRNGITEIPDERWDKSIFHHPNRHEPGKAYTFAAGVVDNVAAFDAAFFGISPREAEQMDPQQRFLLEMTWEALESGGQVPAKLAGKNCSIHIGISGTDYADSRQGDPEAGNAYFMLGSTLSIAANRLSYFFDFNGPSMAIDTACSSSLVALSEAANAIRDGRADMAVAGGMHMLLCPYPFIGFSKASMLADYGRCQTFSKVAEGYVRSEGGGILILKPLDQALADGDPIQGVICGTGANNDGRTRGLALPSYESQQALMEQVMDRFDIDPADFSYYEAHGTGTAVGDPIETRAIGQAVGQKRPSSAGPLPIGSAKSNIGHLEPASGMAGIIKALLILRHGAIPPTLHCEELNPEIDFEALNIAPVRHLTALAEQEKPHLIGVNSFGFGGANASVILRQFKDPGPRQQTSAAGPLPPLFLTGKEPNANRQMAGLLRAHLARNGGEDIYDVAHTLAFRREQMEQRTVVRADSLAALDACLAAYHDGEAVNEIIGVNDGVVVAGKRKIGFLFSGNGSQWPGMGCKLYEQSPLFKTTVDEIDQAVAAVAGWSIVETLFAPDCAEKLIRTEVAQPLLFAIQAGLCSCLSDFGVKPDAVAGHSVGEVAAAYICGALSLEQAVKLIVTRSDAQGKTRGQGKIAAVEIPPERAEELIARFAGRVELAGINGPTSMTLAGDADALEEIGAILEPENVLFKILDLEYAFHSRVLDAAKDGFFDDLGPLAPGPAVTPYYSAVRGSVLAGEDLNTDYWWDNVRQPVRFQDAVNAMMDDGVNIFIEVGPHPILRFYVGQILRERHEIGAQVSVMSRTDNGWQTLRDAVDLTYCAGGQVDLSLDFPRPGNFIELPGYPWQHQDFWYPQSPEARGAMYQRSEGPLLGARPSPGQSVWENQVDCQRYGFLEDHQVGGSVVFPASGFAEIVLEASRVLFGEGAHDIENLEIRRPLLIDPGQAAMLRLHYDEEDLAFRLESRRRMGEEPWSLCLVGRLTKADFGNAARPTPPKLDDSFEEIDAPEHYAVAAALGLDYGPAFQAVDKVYLRGEEAFAQLSLKPEALSSDGFVIHPAAFDGALQVVFDIMRWKYPEASPVAYLPFQLKRLKVHQTGPAIAGCHVKLVAEGERSLVADIILFDADGNCLAEAIGFRFLRAEGLTGGRTAERYFKFTKIPKSIVTSDDIIPTSDDIAALMEPAASPPRAPDLDALAGAFIQVAAGSLADSGDDIPVHLAALLQAHPGEPDPAGAAALAENWRHALARHPEYLAELAGLSDVARNLAAENNSPRDETPDPEQDPLALGPDLKAFLLQGSASFAPARHGMLEICRLILAAWPENRRLRILEIGHDTALIQDLAADIAAGAIDYTVVSRNEAGRSHLTMEIGEIANLKFLAIDMAGPVVESELADLGQFDLVLAPFASLAEGLSRIVVDNIAQTLAPGGLTVIAEPKPAAWLNLLFGMEPGWWQPDSASGSQLHDRERLDKRIRDGGLRNGRHLDFGAAMVIIADAPTTVGGGAPPVPALETAPSLIVARKNGVTDKIATVLAQVMEQSGHHSIVAYSHTDAETAGEDLTLDVQDPGQWAELFEVFAQSGTAIKNLIFLVDDADPNDDDDVGWDLLLAARELSAASFPDKPQLVVVTRGAQALVAGPVDPRQAAHWGLGRVIRNELPGLACVICDLPSGDEDRDHLAGILAETLMADMGEDEILIDATGVAALRIIPGEEPGAGRTTMAARRVDFTPGKLDSLTWRSEVLAQPGPDQVCIENRAAGLNFRDVMYALGALPEEALENGFAGATVGMEAAGVISAVGKNVKDFAVGDEVLCFAPACFSSHIITDTTAVAHKPPALSFAAAATIPTVFFTVYYSLGHLARLQAGERILIHGAAGGVGLAAIQYARHLGAEIFATAGTDAKREILVLLGLDEDHIFDSRSLKFADDIMTVTQGQGVDVVLNSLSGEAIHKNLGILRPFGRFLELGKRDFYENSRIGLKVFRNNLTYHGIDADQLMLEKPDLAQRLFAEMIGLFEIGVFHPLPHRVFSHDQISQAFRYMQQSKQVGKVIIQPPAVESGGAAQVGPETSPQSPDTLTLDPKAAYLVSGGLRGFGLASAQWLAAKGAGALILASRSGARSAEDNSTIAALRDAGVTVFPEPCDVTDLATVTQAIAKAETAGFPLRGIIHAAAVFDDSLIESIEHRQYQDVQAPKTLGAKNLHIATMDKTLDFFVLYSSITTAFGNPGQASYVAANRYLEGLAAMRRDQGLTASVIGWGPISDAGYLTRNADIQDALLAKIGTIPLKAKEAMAGLEKAILNGTDDLYIAPMDWQRLRGALPGLRGRTYENVAGGAGDGGDGDVDELINQILEMSPVEAHELVVALLAEEIGQVLRLTADKIDVTKSVFDLGMDSLMALELRLAVEQRMGIEVPPMVLSEGGSIADLAEYVVKLISGEDEGGGAEGELKAKLSKHLDDDETEALSKVL